MWWGYYIHGADRCILRADDDDIITFDRSGFSSPRQGYCFFTSYRSTSALDPCVISTDMVPRLWQRWCSKMGSMAQYGHIYEYLNIGASVQNSDRIRQQPTLHILKLNSSGRVQQYWVCIEIIWIFVQGWNRPAALVSNWEWYSIRYNFSRIGRVGMVQSAINR